MVINLMIRKYRHKFEEKKYKERFVKYPRAHMKKDTLYKARKHPKQKTLSLKKWTKHP